MKSSIYLLCWFIHAQVWCQNTNEIFHDFNDDGYTDTLRSYYSGGSGYGGRYCELINGASQEKHEVNSGGCFCQIKNVIPIPPVLIKKENKQFLEAIKKSILPEWRAQPDPSLKWIMNANKSYHKLSGNEYFDLIISFQVEWVKKNIELPDTYYIDIEGETFSQLYLHENSTDDKIQVDKEGWLIYYAHNHYRNPAGDSLTLSDKSQIYTAYKTSHGLIIQKEESYAWVFLTDYDLTGGPQKLRWESILKAEIYENHIIIEQSRAPEKGNSIFIVDIEKGICGRMKSLNFSEPFIIENKKLKLENVDSQNSVLFDELKKELKYLMSHN